MKVQVSIQFPLRVVVYPAPDLEGQWIAHGLETDIVTQGDSVEHAMAMMADAVGMMAEFRAERGLFPVNLRPAPTEVWDLVGLSIPSGVVADVVVGGRRTDRTRPNSYQFYSFVSDKAPKAAHAG